MKLIAEFELLILSKWSGAGAESDGLLLCEVCDGRVEVVVNGCFERVVGALGGDDRWTVKG